MSRMKNLFRHGRREGDDCVNGHKNTSRNSLIVVFGNFLLSLLTVFHLAYLGSSFDLSEEVRLLVTRNGVNFTFCWPGFIYVLCSRDMGKYRILLTYHRNFDASNLLSN